jgi:hypothetical protein
LATFEVEVATAAAFASRTVAALERQGLDVEWTPPQEERGIGVGEIVVVALIVRGTEMALEAAVAEIRKRWPKIVIRVRGKTDEP